MYIYIYMHIWKKYKWQEIINNHSYIRSSSSKYGDLSKPCSPSVHINIWDGRWVSVPKMAFIGIDP